MSMQHGLHRVYVISYGEDELIKFVSLDCYCGFSAEEDSAAEAWPAFYAHIKENE